MSSSAPPPATRDRLPGLDGLRAVAVLLVLAYHLFPGLAPGGFIGVDVFFVVSGYLITALLLHEHSRTGHVALRRFWVRRARRLLPALVLVVMVSASLAALIGGDLLVSIGWQLAGAATFTSNWVAIATGASYVDQTSPELLRHLWSLAVEEQFYLLWPLVLLVLLALPRRWMPVAVLSALAVGSAVALALAAGTPALDGGVAASAAYLSTHTHGFGLLAGAALAFARRPMAANPSSSRGARALAGSVTLVALLGLVALSALLSIDGVAAYRGGMALAVLLSLLAIVGLDRSSVAARVANLAPVRWIGERSYGLYLWHWPLVVIGAALLPGIDRSGREAWALGAVVLVLSVLFAAATYRWVEMPLRRDGLRAAAGSVRALVRASRPVAATALALVAALLIAGTTLAVVRAPDSSEAAQLIEAGERALSRPAPVESQPAAGPDEAEPTPSATPTPSPEEAGEALEPPPVATGDQITAIGDSVMLAAAPALVDRFPGIDVDATVGRQMWSLPEVVAEAVEEGSLREVLVIGVGANGDFADSDLAEVLDAVGDRSVVLVTAQAPRAWTTPANGRLRAFAAAHRTVELADWETAIASDLDLLASDQIHPGPTASALYAAQIADALERLAALPPLPDPVDYDEHPELHRPL